MVLKDVAIKNMDHLGLVAGMVDELQIDRIVDAAIGSKSPDKKLRAGELVKAMIINGLGYVNKPLYLVAKFFEDKPLERLFARHVEAAWINDDALGRTLDALYAYGVSELYEKIAQNALNRLGLVPTVVHLDSTSFHVDGSYPHEGKSHAVASSKATAVTIIRSSTRWCSTCWSNIKRGFLYG
jgi:transposase